MDAVERAIRSAFEKGDPSERAFREKVYRSAFSALERFLQSRPDMPAEEIRRRRENLKARITEIESEFVPAVAPEPEASPAQSAPARAAPATNEQTDSAAPSRDPSPSPDRPAAQEASMEPRGAEEQTGTAIEEIDSLVAEEHEPWRHLEEPGRRSRLPRLLVGLVVLAAILAIVLWAIGSGAGLFGGPSDGPATTAQKPAEEETAARPSAANGDAVLEPSREGWIAIFSPSDATAVGVPPGATAEIKEGEDTQFVRIATPSADTAVSFDVGRGVLEQLAGGPAILSLVAEAVEGEETQISVSCDFGGLGECGRKRYVVGDTRAEHLLEIELADGPLPSHGVISIVPDVSGGGRALDVFEIRASRAVE